MGVSLTLPHSSKLGEKAGSGGARYQYYFETINILEHGIHTEGV